MVQALEEAPAVGAAEQVDRRGHAVDRVLMARRHSGSMISQQSGPMPRSIDSGSLSGRPQFAHSPQEVAALGHRFHKDYGPVLRGVLFAVDRHRARQVSGIVTGAAGAGR